MPRKLRDLHPCDSCNGPVNGGIFYVVRYAVAVINRQAVDEYLGMRRFFGGNASDALVENFAPAMARGFTIAMDEPEFKELVTELFICHKCYMDKPLDLPLLSERVNERKKKAEEENADATS